MSQDEPLPDDVLHLQQAVEQFSNDDNDLTTAGQVVNLLGEILELFPKQRWEFVFANDIGAQACFARAYRQLRAALTLLMNGYYSEVGLVLRGAYEAASLARYIARNPDVAERWLKKGEWYPERAVREWMTETRYLGLDEDALRGYTLMYRELSADAHPTARSCLSLVATDGERPYLLTGTAYDEETLRSLLRQVAAVGLFCCFAARNAAVREEVIDPEWRRRLVEVAKTITGETMPHLERDWEAEAARYRTFRQQVRDVANIEDVLEEHPLSDRNLRGHAGSSE